MIDLKETLRKTRWGGLLFLIFCAGMLISFIKYTEYFLETKEEIQELRDSQKAALETVTEKQKEDIIDSQTKIGNLQVKLEDAQKENSSLEAPLSSIIAQWRPRVAHVGCVTSDGVSFGSGLINRFTINGEARVGIVTNKHVVAGATLCAFTVPGSEVVPIDTDDIFTLKDYDVAYLLLPEISSAKQVSSVKLCENVAKIGDKIVVLGYPENGGTEDITATEGIVASYDGNYYVTSAKIDHGNSGGVTVLLRENCYLGIPTYVRAGSLESFGRILAKEFILN